MSTWSSLQSEQDARSEALRRKYRPPVIYICSSASRRQPAVSSSIAGIQTSRGTYKMRFEAAYGTS